MNTLINGLLLSTLLMSSTAAFAQDSCKHTRVVLMQMSADNSRFAQATKLLLKNFGGEVQVKDVETCLARERVYDQQFIKPDTDAYERCMGNELIFRRSYLINYGEGVSLDCRKAIAKTLFSMGAPKKLIRAHLVTNEANTVFVSIPSGSLTILERQEKGSDNIDDLLK